MKAASPEDPVLVSGMVFEVRREHPPCISGYMR